PETKIELSTEGVTSGKHALKLTFAGGRTPTVTTVSPVTDWTRYRAFRADVTASRTCMVVFRALSETSRRGRSYNEGVSRWEKAARLEPGMNTVVGFPPKGDAYRKVVTFEIYMLNPREGETIIVDNIRLSAERPATTTSFNDALAGPVRKNAAPEGQYRVLGTDLEVKDVDDLADRLKDTWQKPDDRTVEEVEAAFRAEYDALKKTHPRAVLAIFRHGQNGCDPANPDKVFTGWTDAGTPSHLPMALTLACFGNSGGSERIETCFRNRPGFLRVDLSSIPKGADVLAARLVVVRGVDMGKNWETKPTMFVAEPCNRPWVEAEVNVFEFAKDRFWNDYAAGTWGDDGDCTAVLLAHGPSGGTTGSWDFTHAVRYWTVGNHPNHGFILYGAPKYVDYLNILSREHREMKHRPALMVVYEPKP
ncbi:MAG TPA: DNRLRE domain-containing protein, partial [Planctomycetota bacterium]|nr:DNRLRE domain-containing protein [Planctomycetota bacterium]